MNLEIVSTEQLHKWRLEFQEAIRDHDGLVDEFEEDFRFEVDTDDRYHDPALQLMWQGYLLRCISKPHLKLVK